MKPKLLLLLLFLLTSLSCYAESKELNCGPDTTKHQKTKPVKKPATRKLTVLELERMHKPWFDNCTFTNQYTLEQRLKKYPFSAAVKVLAISYRSHYELENPAMQDSLNNGLLSPEDKRLKWGGLYIVKHRLDYATLREFKQLNQEQIKQLTNIIYNTDFKKKIGYNSVSESACYEPRNAFIFLDKDDKVYDYLEICFNCERYSSLSEKLNIGVLCTQKYDILDKYFSSVGITYGTR